MQCGAVRTSTPYRWYVRSYGTDGAVRNPGPEYLDPEDVQIVDRVPQTPVDSATDIHDDEPPVEYWPEPESEPADERGSGGQGSEAASSASSSGHVVAGRFTLGAMRTCR